MSVLCLRTLWCLGSNTTTIEGWEIERHHTLLRRSRFTGGFLAAPGGQRVRINKQEYPWDIGIYSNVAQGMGSRNPLVWFWPFAPSLPLNGGTSFPDNGLEEPSTSWPPPDPDRMFRGARSADEAQAFTQSMDVESFRRRQEADLLRYRPAAASSTVQRRVPFHVRLEDEQSSDSRYQRNNNERFFVTNDGDDEGDEDDEDMATPEPPQKLKAGEGEEGWRNSEGERLADFGVDEDAEFYDEDDLPLAELMRRRNAAASDHRA